MGHARAGTCVPFITHLTVEVSVFVYLFMHMHRACTCPTGHIAFHLVSPASPVCLFYCVLIRAPLFFECPVRRVRSITDLGQFPDHIALLPYYRR